MDIETVEPNDPGHATMNNNGWLPDVIRTLIILSFYNFPMF